MVDINDFNAIPSPGGLSNKLSPLMGEGWGRGDHNFFHPPLTPPIKGGEERRILPSRKIRKFLLSCLFANNDLFVLQ